ncbi:MAG: hypothetical protein KDC67_16985, partial [Ignavibacteriae bacterium]|nr:hypothetical protein [Ignavibacteriota bacterium]
VENPNSENTNIYFKANSNDVKYFLYYSNVQDQQLPHIDQYEINDQSTFNVSLGEETQYPISISLNSDFILKGINKLNISVNIDNSLSDSVSAVNYEIVGTDVTSAIINNDGVYKQAVNLADLDTGYYSIQATIYDECFTLKSESKDFRISYPLFVTWTMDWEGYDVSDQYLNQISEISNKYDFNLTQFYNPRLFIAGNVSSNRKAALNQWIKNRQSNGDEVGLHLHMWNDMIRAAGVTPKSVPSWSNAGNGYDVIFSAYDYNESLKILEWAIREMSSNGFTDVKSFRAGGWEIDEDNFRALDKLGIQVDSSGRTSHSLGTNLIQSKWNLAVDSRPYHPSVEDINISGEFNHNIWEFPNNGADSYAYSYEQMKERFDANYNEMMNEPQVVTYLSHPHWFNIDYPKLDRLFSDISQ